MSRTPTSASSPTCSASFWPRPRPQDTRPSRRHRSLMPRCIRTCCGTDRRRTPLACTGASGTGSTGHSTASKRGRQRAAAADSVPSLSGESYAGAVVTEAGTHDSVQSIVYVAAFAPDKGESVNTLIADPPPGAPCRRSCPPTWASSCSTGPSSRTCSPPTFPPVKRPSWPTPRSRGASMPCPAPSPTPPGGAGRAGTSSPPRIG
jgi:hypothetical protein